MSILVGKQAPDFTTAAILKNDEISAHFNLHENIKNKYAVLIFYPLNFTFVCPSELIALDKREQEFKERGVEVIAISIDSHFSHLAWRNTPVAKGGIGPVSYVLAADVKHEICKMYGVEHPSEGVAFRATFLIDKTSMIRSQLVNDLPLGRDMDELLRLVDALQFHDQHGEVCPAGWKKGDKGMIATTKGVASYLQEFAENL